MTSLASYVGDRFKIGSKFLNEDFSHDKIRASFKEVASLQGGFNLSSFERVLQVKISDTGDVYLNRVSRALKRY